MAPSTAAVELLSPKEKNRLRKPVVEKMRRDRINSSIEQLKLLLEQEFAPAPANSKLEKADILEMAVRYLKHSKAFAAAGPKSRHRDFSEGYAWCLQEAVQFLTLHAAGDAQMKLLCHFQRPPAAPGAPATEPKAAAPPAAKAGPAAHQPPAASGGPGDPAGVRAAARTRGPLVRSEEPPLPPAPPEAPPGRAGPAAAALGERAAGPRVRHGQGRLRRPTPRVVCAFRQ